MNIPFHKPMIEDDDVAAVVETLKSGWITTGPGVKAFEKSFSEYTGAKHAIAVSSCTAAMHLALAALDIGPGDAVITTPYTFVATAEAIQYVGATPVFVDIRERDLNIDPDQIAKLIREWKTSPYFPFRLRALMPVHMAGHPCDMSAIMQVARDNNLAVVEDAAHCLEGAVKNYHDGSGKIGAIGDATCFSFYATKNITTAEGGMVTTENDQLADRMRILSLHGMSRDAWKRYSNEGSWYYEILARGFKYNMPDLLAALGRTQLQKAGRMLEIRRRHAQILHQELSEVEEIILPVESDDSTHAWHLFIIRLQPERLKITRNQFIEKLTQAGVHTSVHFIPLHLQPFFRDRFKLRKGDFPVAEKVYDSAVSLPFYPSMADEDVRRVAGVVREVIMENARF
jgi:dTDP-4-amino-4,6-dideoxygalactose transaminase